MRQPLYQITQSYIKAYDALSSDEELPPEAVRDTLAGLSLEINEKALNIAAIIKNMRADENAMREAELAINGRRKRLEKRINGLENYLSDCLCGENIDLPIQSAEHYINFRASPASVQIQEGAKIPVDCTRTVPAKVETDKNLLKEAIKNGRKIEGVSLVKNVKLVIK